MIPHWTELRAELKLWLTTQHRILVGCDFDGTLSAIVDHADDADLPGTTRDVLDRLHQLPGVQVAVISGRGLADVRSRVGLSGLSYSGNHGLEMQMRGSADILAPGAGAGQAKLREIITELESILPRVPGVWVEDKHWSASVHYRLASEEHHALVGQIVQATLSGIEELTLRSGHRTWEIRPATSWNKGAALKWFLDQSEIPSSAGAFIGDDVTDLDAFAVLPPEGWACVVGDTEAPTARARIADPGDTAMFLTWLADVRMSAF